MLRHDAETLFQRSLVVLGSHSLVQIVNKSEVCIVKVFGLLHDTDAPIKIGREAIPQVVRIGKSQFPTAKKA